MSEEEKRKHRCCFTGHRPEKLNLPEDEVRSWLEKEIRQAIADGFITFISGMARGVDICAAEIVLRIKEEERLPIHLICCIPYDNFESRWPPSWWMRYADILKRADIVHFTGHQYHRGCEQVRNKYMVDHSDRVIAVYNGTPGGTKNTIDYAKSLSRNIRLMQNNDKELYIIPQNHTK